MIDYRNLLMRYIDYVCECDGSDFLHYREATENFSEEEKAVLIQLALEGHEFVSDKRREDKVYDEI